MNPFGRITALHDKNTKLMESYNKQINLGKLKYILIPNISTYFVKIPSSLQMSNR